MSEPNIRTPRPPGPSGGQVAMIVVGVILLLPGLCSLLLLIGALPELHGSTLSDPISQMIFLLWGVCFAVSAFGIVLIVMARRRAQRPP